MKAKDYKLANKPYKKFQEHHISYDPPVVVIIYKGEHFVLSQIERRKNFSKGFFQALKFIMLEREHTGQHLEMPKEILDYRRKKRAAREKKEQEKLAKSEGTKLVRKHNRPGQFKRMFKV